MWYRVSPKVVPQTILPPAVTVKLLSSTAVQTVDQIWIFYCPGAVSGPSHVLMSWPVWVQTSNLKNTVVQRPFILNLENSMISISIQFLAINPPFSQQKATIGTLKTAISRYNVVFLTTATHCQDELWRGEHARVDWRGHFLYRFWLCKLYRHDFMSSASSNIHFRSQT